MISQGARDRVVGLNMRLLMLHHCNVEGQAMTKCVVTVCEVRTWSIRFDDQKHWGANLGVAAVHVAGL